MLKILFVLMFFFLCDGKPGLATCPGGGGDRRSTCGRWKRLGYCDPKKGAWRFMAANCPASCGLCQGLRKVNITECLQAHNSKRALHGAAPLTWDTSLARKAEAWASYLTTRNLFEHAPWSVRLTGENLNLRIKLGKSATCKDAVESWYREVHDYPFHNPPNSVKDTEAPTGHFTQVVWKSTKKLGVGIATVTWRNHWIKTYIVARYSPSGNYPGRLKQEVGKKIAS